MAILQCIFRGTKLLNGKGLTQQTYLTIGFSSKLLKSDYQLPVNIGNPNEISMNELASIVLKLTNSNSKIVHQNLPEDDPKKRRPEISLAKDLISWYPKIDLESNMLGLGWHGYTGMGLDVMEVKQILQKCVDENKYFKVWSMKWKGEIKNMPDNMESNIVDFYNTLGEPSSLLVASCSLSYRKCRLCLQF